MTDVKKYFEQGSGIVTLCGSTKFFFECQEANRLLTFMNWVVLQSGSYGHSFSKYAQKYENHDYEVVKKLHFHKIMMSDCILVVSDESNYIGESTRAEISFAHYLDKPVFYYDGVSFTGQTDKYIPNCFDDSRYIDNFAKLNGTLGY